LPAVLNVNAILRHVANIQIFQTSLRREYIRPQLPLSSFYLQVSDKSEESGDNDQHNGSNGSPNVRRQMDEPFYGHVTPPIGDALDLDKAGDHSKVIFCTAKFLEAP
jgi:hypothetical protein